METQPVEKSVTFKSVHNTYKYIEDFIGAHKARELAEPRKSVDLERMFFGAHESSDSEHEDAASEEQLQQQLQQQKSNKEQLARAKVESIARRGKLANRCKESSAHHSSQSEEDEEEEGVQSPPDQQQKVTFVGSAHLMARFYSRLKEIRQSKGESEGSTSPSEGGATEKNDRRRIKTALRRLLTERLFPHIQPTAPVEPLPVGGEVSDPDLLSGAATPFHLGVKSKTSRSLHSKGTGESTSHSATSSKGCVVLVESQEPHTDNKNTDRANPLRSQQILGYYRRHAGPLKKDAVSRLYQPARPSPPEGPLSPRDALLRDPEFIQSLRAQIGKHNGKASAHHTPGNSKRPAISWTYNQPRNGGKQPADNRPHTTNGQSQASLEDAQLRRLLEELFRDKKYMDSLILSKGDNATEEEVARALQAARGYLLDRAAYWLERGPLPARPPASALGLRLEREQSMMSARSLKVTSQGETSRETGSGSVSSQSSREPQGRELNKGNNPENKSAR